MKPILTILFLIVAFLGTSVAAPAPKRGRTITDINVIPTRVLERSVSRKFYKSLVVSPIEGWIVVRANLSGTRLSGARVIRSDLNGLYDPLALELAKEAVIAGNYTIERPNLAASVLLHLLVYQIADGTMVLSFSHFDAPGGDQEQYYGCARLLTLKANKWTEIRGPESLQGKGWAVRQGLKNDIRSSLRLEGGLAAETTNYNRNSSGNGTREGY